MFRFKKIKKSYRVSCKPVKQNVEMHNSAPLSCSVDYFKSSMGERLKIRGHHVFITANKHVWLTQSFEWKINVCRTVDRRQMLVGFLSSVKGGSEQSLQWSAADHCIISHYTIIYTPIFFLAQVKKLFLQYFKIGFQICCCYCFFYAEFKDAPKTGRWKQTYWQSIFWAINTLRLPKV